MSTFARQKLQRAQQNGSYDPAQEWSEVWRLIDKGNKTSGGFINGAKIYASASNELYHNFIIADGKVYRINETLGEGNFGKVKSLTNYDNEKFIIKSMDTSKTPPHLRGKEAGVLQKLGRLMGQGKKTKAPFEILNIGWTNGLSNQFGPAVFQNDQIVGYLDNKSTPRYYQDGKIIPKSKFITEKEFIIEPAAEGFEVGKAIDEKGRVRESTEAKQLMKDPLKFLHGAALALRDFQANDLVHRDIKPPNMFYDEKTGKVTLVDMGLAIKAGEKDVACGTPLYMAPEIFKLLPQEMQRGLLEARKNQSPDADAAAPGVMGGTPQHIAMHPAGMFPNFPPECCIPRNRLPRELMFGAPLGMDIRPIHGMQERGMGMPPMYGIQGQGMGMPPMYGIQGPGMGMPPMYGMQGQGPGIGMPPMYGMQGQGPGIGMPPMHGMQAPEVGMPPMHGMQGPGMGMPMHGRPSHIIASKAMDVYSLGVIANQLGIKNDLVARMLNSTPEKRPSIQEVEAVFKALRQEPSVIQPTQSNWAAQPPLAKQPTENSQIYPDTFVLNTNKSSQQSTASSEIYPHTYVLNTNNSAQQSDNASSSASEDSSINHRRPRQ